MRVKSANPVKVRKLRNSGRTGQTSWSYFLMEIVFKVLYSKQPAITPTQSHKSPLCSLSVICTVACQSEYQGAARSWCDCHFIYIVFSCLQFTFYNLLPLINLLLSYSVNSIFSTIYGYFIVNYLSITPISSQSRMGYDKTKLQ
jgi:hypothetical protein